MQIQNKMYLGLSYRALLKFDGLQFRIYAPLSHLLSKTNIIRRFLYLVNNITNVQLELLTRYSVTV